MFKIIRAVRFIRVIRNILSSGLDKEPRQISAACVRYLELATD
jgi:hypothetical protein